MYKSIKSSGLIALLLLTILVSITNAAEFTIMQGWLIGEDCLKAKKSPCPLRGFSEDKLILLTIDEKAYRIEENGVEDWKLQKAYGQLIGLKGLRESDIIKVNDIVQITGGKKLTKSCK